MTLKSTKTFAPLMNEGEEEEEIDIRPDKYITLINLTPGELNLTTLSGGAGKVFTFRSFGDKKRVLYGNLVDVMEANPRFLEEGFFYIADKKVIMKHGLEDIYKNILTKESIEKILSGASPEDAAALYKSANKSQQEMILNLLVRKLAGGAEMNLNAVDAISRVSKVDISAKVEEAKFYSQPLEA
jgi:hypothetical protein